MKRVYIIFIVLIFVLTACSAAETAPLMQEEAAATVTEQPEIAANEIELDYDLGGWPEAPLPAAEPPFSGICYVAFNTEKAPFDNVLVRQAFAYSLDREDIAQNATCSECDFHNQRPAITLIPQDYYLLESGSDFYSKWVNHEIPQLKNSSDFYQKWLDDQWYRDLLLEGYTPEDMTIQLVVSDENLQIAQSVAEDWHDYLAVDMELMSLESAIFDTSISGSDAPQAYVTCNYMDLASPSDLLIGLVSGYYGDYIRWDAPDVYYQAAFAGYQNDDINAYLQAESMLTGEYAVIAPLFSYTVE